MEIIPSHIRNEGGLAAAVWTLGLSLFNLGKRQEAAVGVESGISQSLCNQQPDKSHSLSHTRLSEHAVLVTANSKTSSLFKHT